MEKLWRWLERHSTYLCHWIRNIALALWLSLWITNFSYSQENVWWNGNKIEQTNGSKSKSIDAYKIKIANRDNNITNNTSETLDEFVSRLQRQFYFEISENAIIQQKINWIKDILNKKYSQNITNNDPFFIIQMALKMISNGDKYIWLSKFSNNFSWKFDLNFVNALWYLQYMNEISGIWIISWKNWENTLDKIIYDLNNNQNKGIIQDNTFYNWDTAIIGQELSNSQNNAQLIGRQESIKVSINNHTNRIYPSYATKIENRNNNIIHHSSETLDDFVQRMSKQFEFELKDKNSLIPKKILSIKELLNNKYNYQLDDSPIIVVESALKVLSKNEKYQWLQEYLNSFSWKFDLNFIDAYWLFQYINDWTCSWSISWKSWALLLQSICDELNCITSDNYVVEEYNEVEITKDTGNNEEITQNNSKDIINCRFKNVDINQNENSNIEPINIEIEWITLLSNNLSLDKLSWITYEDVWNTVNWFRHEWLKNAVMDCLLHNDVIWAQELLWMDLNCNPRRYPDFVAGKKLWKRELELMEKHSEYRRYMDNQEFLNNMEKVERAYEIENYEVKTAYLKFLSWEFDNGWLPYCIISKRDYKIYLFSADHKFLSSHPILTWAKVGDHMNDAWDQKDPKKAHHTTPGWMYEFWWFFDKSLNWDDLTAKFGTDYWVFVPLEWQYKYSDEYSLWIHGYVKGRRQFFFSEEMKDHRKSAWCINFLREIFWEIYNHLKVHSKIYICRDDKSYYDDDIWYNSNNISEKIADKLLDNFAKHNPSKIWNNNILEKWFLNRSKSLNWRNYCNINNQINNTPYYQNKYHNYHQKKYLV